MSGSGLKSKYCGLGVSKTQLRLFLISQKKICLDTDEMMNIYYTYHAVHDGPIVVPRDKHTEAYVKELYL